MNSTVKMCANTEMVPVQCKTECVPLLTDEQNGNDLPSPLNPSPDSARSTSSLSNRSVESPPDVEMFECLSDGNSGEGDPTRSSSPPVSPTLFKVNRNTTIQALNVAMVMTDLQNGSYIQHGSVDGSSRDFSPLLSSVSLGTPDSYSLPSCCSSSDGSMDRVLRCHSDGSLDRVLRSNSFCLQDSDQVFSISYLAESAGSPATLSDLDTPHDAHPFWGPDGTPKEDMKHRRLGDDLLSPNNQTFFLEESTGQSALSAGGKARGSPFAVPSKFDYATPETGRSGNSVVKLLHSNTLGSGQRMTAGDKTFVVPGPEDGDPSNVQTSTPVQSLGNVTFCLPTLNESPFTEEPGEQGSSKADGMKQQPGYGTTRTTGVLKAAAAAPKVKKPDFSSVRPKIISRQASTSKSSNLPVVKASPFCSSKRMGDQVQRPSHPTQSKPSPTVSTSSAVSSPSVSSNKFALSKVGAPPSGQQEKPPASHKNLLFPKARPRLGSDSSLVPKSKADTQHQRGKTVPPSFIAKVYKAVTQSKAVSANLKRQLQFKPGDWNGSASSQEGAAKESRKELSKISLKTVCTKPVVPATGAAGAAAPRAAGAARAAGAGAGAARAGGAAVAGPAAGGVRAAVEGRKARFGVQPSPCRDRVASPLRERGAPASPAAQAASPRLLPNMARLRLGGARGVSPNKDSQAASHSKNVLNNMSAGMGSTRPLDPFSGAKHSPKRALPPVTPSRIPVQPAGQTKSVIRSSQASVRSTPGYGESCSSGERASTSKALGLRPRLQTPAKSITTTVYRSLASSSSHPAAIKPAPSSLKKLPLTRPARANTAQPVDKNNKQKPTARNQQPQQVNGHREPAAPVKKACSAECHQAQCEKNTKTLQDLKSVILESNRRFEAVSVVLQHCLAEREESLRKCEQLSVELVNLREDLVNSSQSRERLEREKDELRGAFDGVLQKLQEQHRSDLVDLEERLRTFYSNEWEMVHQVYQEEANKCKAQMEQQLESLRFKHEVLRKDLEASHAEKMESITQQYEQSLEELRKSHEAEMQTLDKMLKETKVNLTGQIEELRTENSALNEKLQVVENEMWKETTGDSQADSNSLYLEQELESLKVVLDIKNKQLHQQDKKLMEMDKVLEKNVKLGESLQKVQQENEDFKARMNKHMALSRQLSSEQSALQESLQKEAKMNHRLSMENEELLWKLHNGDLGSPRKLSPPSPSMPLQSPRNSGIFSSPPVSPR